MADVRGDSRICIVDPSGSIKTVICEEDYERLGYKEKGWTVVENDWTKDRTIKQPIDYSKERSLTKLAEGAK